MGVALVAAYVLVLQALVGAFALGAAASPVLDAFGNPLCITSAASPDSGSDRNHGYVPDCCTIACNMFAAVAAEDRTPSSLANPLPTLVEELIVAVDNVDRTPSPERNPGSPRSPPLIAA